MNTTKATSEIISAEDKDLIRAMVGLPMERKILAKGVILGLSLTDRIRTVQLQNVPSTSPPQPPERPGA